MKKYPVKNRSVRYLIVLALAISTVIKANEDYQASKAAANLAVSTAKFAAAEARTNAIVKAKAIYGTYIESVGHGVLIP